MEQTQKYHYQIQQYLRVKHLESPYSILHMQFSLHNGVSHSTFHASKWRLPIFPPSLIKSSRFIKNPSIMKASTLRKLHKIYRATALNYLWILPILLNGLTIVHCNATNKLNSGKHHITSNIKRTKARL